MTFSFRHCSLNVQLLGAFFLDITTAWLAVVLCNQPFSDNDQQDSG